MSSLDQLDLFLGEEEINPAYCVDISDIDIDFGDTSYIAEQKSKTCKRLQDLPKGKYLIYKGEPKRGHINEVLPYIKNTHKGRIVSTRDSRNTYPSVDVGNRSYCMHIIVCMAFIPNVLPKDRTHVDHIDGDKNNYAVENLRWVTPSENQLNKDFKKRNPIELELDL